jgi:hypothetical protein
MGPVDPSATRELLEAFIAAFSVLGGGMAYTSGFRAAETLARNDSPAVVSHSINEGVGAGFEIFSPLSIIALIIMVWG